jgi:hypothetical protein
MAAGIPLRQVARKTTKVANHSNGSGPVPIGKFSPLAASTQCGEGHPDERRSLAAVKIVARPADHRESDSSGARAQVREKYVIHSSRRQVAVTTAWSAGEALIEYLRSRGFRDDELVRMRFDAVSWHGAIFTATKLVEDVKTS